MKKIKLYVLTGFLGSGKTSFLLNMLKNIQGKKVGVIQNEFGKVSIDGEILNSIDDSSVDIYEISNGSIFCTCKKLDFVKALAEMSVRDLDMLFVESSGLADPSNLGEVFEAAKVLAKNDFLEEPLTICLIDGVNFFHEIETDEAANRQVVHCNVALINKRDLIEDEEYNKIYNKVKQMNPNALILETEHGKTDISILDFDVSKYNWAEGEETTNGPSTKPKTFSAEPDSCSMENMDAFLKAVLPECHRIKGFAVLDGKMMQIDVVGKIIDYKPCDKEQKAHLIFISNVGIQLLRTINDSWKKYVGVPIKLHN